MTTRSVAGKTRQPCTRESTRKVDGAKAGRPAGRSEAQTSAGKAGLTLSGTDAKPDTLSHRCHTFKQHH